MHHHLSGILLYFWRYH